MLAYASYSVGCYSPAGRAYGAEFATEADAEAYADAEVKSGRAASAEVNGWDGDDVMFPLNGFYA